MATTVEPQRQKQANGRVVWLRLPVPPLRFRGPWVQVEPPRVSRPEPEPSGVTFAQLVWAHFKWAHRRDGRGRVHEAHASLAELEREYAKKLAKFEREHGRLVHVYWSRAAASAVGMTVKRRRRRLEWLPFVERDAAVELHRLSDWVTRDTPAIADLLHECDLMAVRVGEVLRGTSERIAMRSIFNIESHLLGYVERADDKVDERAEKKLVEKQRRDLATVEDYYLRAAARTGRIVYVAGMLYGFLLAALVGAVAIGLLDLATGMRRQQLELLTLSYGAGALGALISVMSRMVERGSFEIDFELGRPLMRRLGMYRPFVGAVVGVAFYMLLASRFLEVAIPDGRSTYYYGFFAFLSGFSERFAFVVFGAAESKLGGAAKDSGKPAGRAGASAPGA